jgi:glycosyltransferase involved in cell wall biosynthesis
VSARLTLAIPFHRGLAYLREAIDSVRAQSDGRWQLQVLDDGGEPGGARELVEGYADDRIAYRANERHLGMVASWNRCFDLAATGLVTLLHADDRLLPDYVALAIALADTHPEAVAVFCQAIVIGSDGRPVFSLPDRVKAALVPRGPEPLVLRGEDGLRALARGDFVFCPTLCYRKSVLGDRRFDDRWRQVQDLDLLARLILDGDALVGSRRAAYAYRRHTESATALQSESLLRFEEEFALLDELARRAEARGWSSAARVARHKTVVRLHLALRVASDLLRLRPGAARRKLHCLVQGGTSGAGGMR